MDKEQSKVVIDEILSRLDIVDIISEHIVLKRSGANYLGLCPFHQEKTPSFSVNQEKQIFRCFGCGVGGNLLEFYKRYHNLHFRDALKELAKRAGININWQETPQEKEVSDKKENQRKKLLEIYRVSLEFYRWNLEHRQYGEIARGYLKGRSLSKQMIDKFMIGFSQNSWDSLYIYLQKKGFNTGEIKETGLITDRNDGSFYDRFRNRIIFPIQNEKDEVIAFGGRTLDSNQAKYINSPETPIYIKGQNLFALNFAKNKIKEFEQVILVEGYLDVISCHQFGFENTVASLGTALTPEQAKKLLRYTTSKKIIVAYDADNAGQKAAERGTTVLEEVARGTGINIYILRIPSGKDPDEFLHSEGKDEFQKVVDSSKPIVEFQIEQALAGDFKTPQSKTLLVDKCVEILRKVENVVYRTEMIKKIINWQIDGNKIDIREEDLRQRLKALEAPKPAGFPAKQNVNFQSNTSFQKSNYNKKNFKPGEDYIDYSYDKKVFSQKMVAEYEKVTGIFQAEKGLIYFMIERKKALNFIKDKLENIAFLDPVNEKIKNVIFSLSSDEEKLTWNELLKTMNNSDEQIRVVEIWDGSGDIDISSDKILRDYLKLILHNFIKIQRDEIKGDIDEAAKNGQNEIIRNLMEIYSDLQKKIKQIEKDMGQTKAV